jgi:hypothetical protein
MVFYQERERAAMQEAEGILSSALYLLAFAFFNFAPTPLSQSRYKL